MLLRPLQLFAELTAYKIRKDDSTSVNIESIVQKTQKRFADY